MATKQVVAVVGFLAFAGTFLTLAATVGAIVAVKVVREERRWMPMTQPCGLASFT
jgi:hypothetical protein